MDAPAGKQVKQGKDGGADALSLGPPGHYNRIKLAESSHCEKGRPRDWKKETHCATGSNWTSDCHDQAEDENLSKGISVAYLRNDSLILIRRHSGRRRWGGGEMGEELEDCGWAVRPEDHLNLRAKEAGSPHCGDALWTPRFCVCLNAHDVLFF